MSTFRDKLVEMGLNKALEYIASNPEKNLPKALDWLEKLDKEGYYKTAYQLVREALADPDNIWNIYLKSLYTDLDDAVRQRFFENFIINASVIGNKKRHDAIAKYDCNIPWAILMDPTSACNLHCTGCWAAEYGNQLSLDLETLNRIIVEGKELGTYMYIYSGGEPMVRKKDIITLCERHPDCQFLAFTNATLIDEAFADEMLRVKNFIPAISVEGFEKETDMRRGEGTYKSVVRAMEILKNKKLPFGFSTCYTSKNCDVVGSEAYIDDMMAKGCKFGWYFTYMPIGQDAVPELMATAEQRSFMYDQIRKFRAEKPMFVLDFWNDGEYVNGCIAGGRHYLHINANGDVEPCAFIHYANMNIKEHSLIECLQSPLFMQYRKNQPFNRNQLRPCPLLDNQGKLAQMVHESGAHSTDFIAPEDIDDLTAKCKDAADKWEPVSKDIWEHSKNYPSYEAKHAAEWEKRNAQ